MSLRRSFLSSRRIISKSFTFSKSFKEFKLPETSINDDVDKNGAAEFDSGAEREVMRRLRGRICYRSC